MSAIPRPFMSEAEYLAYDLASPVRNEFVNGEVVAMARAHPAHSQVVMNLGVALTTRLRGGPCRAFVSDQRVRVDETGLYAYPDVVVFCGRPEYAPTNPPTLLNPKVVIEVLSDSTSEFDRGAKFAHFQRRASLQEFVLVSWRDRRVEHYRRIEPNQWHLTIVERDGDVVFPALAVAIPLLELFEGIEAVMPAEPEEPDPVADDSLKGLIRPR